MVQLSLSVSGVGKGICDVSVLPKVWHFVVLWVSCWLVQALRVKFLSDCPFSLSERLVRSENFSIYTEVRDPVVFLEIWLIFNRDSMSMLSLSLINVLLGQFDIFIDAKVRNEVVSLRFIWLFP